MSGGRFSYDQYKFTEIADEVDNIIKNNDTKDDYGYSNGYSKETLNRMSIGSAIMRVAAVYAQRIDWLVSSDDSEESFHSRLDEDLEEIKLKESK